MLQHAGGAVEATAADIGNRRARLRATDASGSCCRGAVCADLCRRHANPPRILQLYDLFCVRMTGLCVPIMLPHSAGLCMRPHEACP